MKKMVVLMFFIFILMYLFSSNTIIDADENLCYYSHEYDVIDGSLSLGVKSNLTHRYICVKYDDLNSDKDFEMEIGTGEENFYYNSFLEINNGFYLYGYCKVTGEDTDAFIYKINRNGTIEWFDIYDIDLFDDFYNVKEIDGGIIIELITGPSIEAQHEVKAFIVKYDIYGNFEWCRDTGVNYFSNFIVRDDVVVFSNNYLCNENQCITSEGVVLNNETYLEHYSRNVMATYSGSVILNYIGDATLNGRIIQTPYTISEPGFYELNISILQEDNSVLNANVEFLVEAVIEGVTDLEYYDRPIDIIISGGSATLNGESVLNTFTVSNVGEYEIIVNGAKDYIKTISFTMELLDVALIDNYVYTEPVVIEYEGTDAFVNDVAVSNGYVISENGDYVFKIIQDEVVIKEVRFSILIDSNIPTSTEIENENESLKIKKDSEWYEGDSIVQISVGVVCIGVILFVIKNKFVK